MARTLIQLATMIRRRLGWPSTDTFVSDTELFEMIRESQRELFDFMVSVHHGMYRLTSTQVTIVANQSSYLIQRSPDATLGDVIGVPLSRVVRVAAKFGDKSIRMRQFDLETDDLDYTPVTWDESTDIRYRFGSGVLFVETIDRVLYVYPVPATSGTVEIWYNAGPATLSVSGAIQDLENDEYIVLDGMIKCLQMEETDASSVMAQKERLIQRLTNESPPLDVGQPQQIQDARGLWQDRATIRGWW